MFIRALAVITVAVLATACGSHEGKPEDHEEAVEETKESVPDKTTIRQEAAEAAGIRVSPAAAGVIADEHEVQGLLTPVEGRVAQITARFPGPIRSVSVSVGDRVRAGQVLASIESNLSLSTYDVVAPLGGVVMARNAALGTSVAEGAPLFEVADLSQLWVDLHIFGSDAQHIKAGAALSITRLSDGVVAPSKIERILPGMATVSQSTVARATISNADGQWRPGSAVKARITVAQDAVALVVPLSALQTVEDHDVVYVREGEDTYHTREVELGRRDSERAEVVKGLAAGELVVVEQSFLVKADIEKSTVEEEE